MVVCASDNVIPKTVVTRTVALRYPAAWSARRNPEAERVDRETEGWLSDRGLLPDAAAHRTYTKLCVADYVGWPFPGATGARFDVIARFFALWIFYDDRLEEADDGQSDTLLAATAGLDEVHTDDPYVRAWAELGRACATETSPEWSLRHAERFRTWACSVRAENVAAERFRETGVRPRALDHLEARVTNIGMMPSIDFLDYLRGYELPAELLEHPAFLALDRSAAAVVAIQNDVHAWEKDRRARWPNLVDCLADDHRVPIDRAFELAVALHDGNLAALRDAEDTLLALFPEVPSLPVWLRDLHHLIGGFARFHHTAPRYGTRFETDVGVRVRLELVSG